MGHLLSIKAKGNVHNMMGPYQRAAVPHEDQRPAVGGARGRRRQKQQRLTSNAHIYQLAALFS